jgi:hypothetical protein
VKYILITALLLIALCAAYAQTSCHDEYICTPMNGCRWVSVCSQTPAPPPRPQQCHDEYICTPMGGCRWITVCR